MNPGHRLLLAGAEAAERAAGPERGAFVYRTVAEQTNGEGRDAALTSYLRCAIASENPKLIEQAIESWSLVEGDVFGTLYTHVLRLYERGNGPAAMRLLRKEHARGKSLQGSFLFGLGLQELEYDLRGAARIFAEIETKAPDPNMRTAARIRRLHAEVKLPRRRARVLAEAKRLSDRDSLPPLERRLAAEVDLYANSRFRRAAALQQLAELAMAKRGGAEPDAAIHAVRHFLECRGESVTPLEHDRAFALFAALKREGTSGLGATLDHRIAPSPALQARARALAVTGGAMPLPTPVDDSAIALLLEFVAESALPDASPAPHTATLLTRLTRQASIDVDYIFRCLDHVWKSGKTSKEGKERSVVIARAALLLPGTPQGGFLGFAEARSTPASLHLDLAFAAMAAEEKGASLALVHAAQAFAGGDDGTVGRNGRENAYRLLREVKRLVDTP